VYGYGADSMEVKLTYANSKVSDRIMNKLNSLIGRKTEFDKISVIGRNDQNFESVFNTDEVINRVLITAEVDEKTEQYEPQSVFNLLISQIK
jgi:hypothetical protein